MALNSSNYNSEPGNPHWKMSLVIWMTIDGILSVCLTLTKIVIVLGELNSNLPYLHKLCFSSCYVAGVLYGVTRFVGGLVIYYLCNNTGEFFFGPCAAVVCLELILFCGNLISLIGTVLLLLIELSRPMNNFNNIAPWMLAFIWLLCIGVCTAGLPGLAERFRESVKWHDCTWNIYPVWNKQVIIYGLLTPTVTVGVISTGFMFRLASHHTARVANQTRVQEVNRETQGNSSPHSQPQRRSSRAWAIRICAIVGMLSPNIIFLDYYISTFYTYASITCWSLLSLLELIVDSLYFLNRELLAGIRKFWRKVKSRVCDY